MLPSDQREDVWSGQQLTGLHSRAYLLLFASPDCLAIRQPLIQIIRLAIDGFHMDSILTSQSEDGGFIWRLGCDDKTERALKNAQSCLSSS
jgi:hypothetical protein